MSPKKHADVDDMIEEVVSDIEERADPDILSKEEVLDFYRGVIEELKIRMEAIREEIGEDDE